MNTTKYTTAKILKKTQWQTGNCICAKTGSIHVNEIYAIMHHI